MSTLIVNRRNTLALVGAFALAAAVSAGANAQGRGNGDDRGNRRGPDRLSGTYELDASRSDNAQQAANRATRSLPPGQRDRVYRNLVNRLDSPNVLSIDVEGRSVTIMSSNAPQATFDADGRDRVEEWPGGRQVTTRADVRRNVLTVSTSGNRGSDFTATFEPVPGGLRVTRTLDSDMQRVSLVVRSFYRRAEERPRWNVYGGGGGAPPPMVLVSDGTQLTGRLDRAMSTRTAREGERFTVTIEDPGQFRDAVIDGSVVRSNGRAGRADIVFDFDRIRMRDGRAGSFEGEIQAVRLPDGTEVRVDRSGVVRDQPRPQGQVVQNGAIGAAIGAIIGAVAGGGKGAIVGAVVGGGAGMLLVDGRDELTLPVGTRITIMATSRRYAAAPR